MAWINKFEDGLQQMYELLDDVWHFGAGLIFLVGHLSARSCVAHFFLIIFLAVIHVFSRPLMLLNGYK